MDRLLRLALFLLALAVVGDAAAQGIPSDGYPVQPVQQYTWQGLGPMDSGSLCTAIAKQYTGNDALGPYGVVSSGGSSLYCDVHHMINAYNGPCGSSPCGDADVYSATLQPAGVVNECPDPNSAEASYPGGSYCQCKSGYSATGSSCKPGSAPPPTSCPSTGTTMPSGGASYTWSGIASGGAGCVGGCAVWSEGTNSPGGGGVPYTVGDFISAGSTCGPGSTSGNNAPPSTPKTPDQASCTGATACSGTVNGVTVCVACGTPSTTTVTSGTTTNPDGSTAPGNTTVSSTSDNGNGTTTTTTTTYGSGGAVIGQTVTTGPSKGSGSSTGSGTGTGTGSGNCTGSNCGDGTDSFGGSCSAAFTCDGDAIQCAIVQEQHQRDCTFYQPDQAGGTVQTETTRFTTALNDGIAPSWSPAASGNASNTVIDFGTGLDRTKQWGSTCPADQSLSFMGQSFLMPLSSMCGSLQLLGNFILAVTALACAGIVFKK